MTLPSSMHAVICRGSGSPDIMVWSEVPLPSVGQDGVLIKVVCAGLNRADILQRLGKYPPPEGASTILGMEVSGVIAHVGPAVKRWKIGDKVCALLAGGGYAEYVAVAENHCLPVPQNVSFVEAAGLPEAVITVYANLFEAGALKPGERALIHGGSSGIGTIAIQMAKLHGAKVIATAGTDEKCAVCRQLGAETAINYNAAEYVRAVAQATGDKGVDVVLDMVGGDYVARNLVALAPLGRHVSIGTQRGAAANIDLRLVMQKRLTLTGSTLRTRTGEEKARLIREVEAKIWPSLNFGGLKPLIYRTYSIKNVADAHKVMESGAHSGKIVFEVSAWAG